jgi:hypothetical protein
VGCSDGKVYGFKITGILTAGAPTSPASIVVGDGSPTGGIVDPPMIDAVNGFLYVESGFSSLGSSVLVQVKTDMSSSVTAQLVTGLASGPFNLHAPAFSDDYFSNPGNPATWILYALAPESIPNSSIDIDGITFDSSHVMQVNGSGQPVNILSFNIGSFEFSPATEFLTTSGTPEDRLFESVLNSPFASGDLASFNITPLQNGNPASGFPGGLESSSGVGSTDGKGTSGIVVDNASALGQANSIYYGTLGSGSNANKAVKLTQSGLL